MVDDSVSAQKTKIAFNTNWQTMKKGIIDASRAAGQALTGLGGTPDLFWRRTDRLSR